MPYQKDATKEKQKQTKKKNMVGAILGPAVRQVRPAVRLLRSWLRQRRQVRTYVPAWRWRRQQPERSAIVTGPMMRR